MEKLIAGMIWDSQEPPRQKARYNRKEADMTQPITLAAAQTQQAINALRLIQRKMAGQKPPAEKK